MFYSVPTDNGIDMLADYPNAEVLLAGDLNTILSSYFSKKEIRIMLISLSTKSIDFVVEDDADFIFGENCTYPTDDCIVVLRPR